MKHYHFLAVFFTAAFLMLTSVEGISQNTPYSKVEFVYPDGKKIMHPCFGKQLVYFPTKGETYLKNFYIGKIDSFFVAQKGEEVSKGSMYVNSDGVSELVSEDFFHTVNGTHSAERWMPKKVWVFSSKKDQENFWQELIQPKQEVVVRYNAGEIKVNYEFNQSLTLLTLTRSPNISWLKEKAKFIVCKFPGVVVVGEVTDKTDTSISISPAGSIRFLPDFQFGSQYLKEIQVFTSQKTLDEYLDKEFRSKVIFYEQKVGELFYAIDFRTLFDPQTHKEHYKCMTSLQSESNLFTKCTHAAVIFPGGKVFSGPIKWQGKNLSFEGKVKYPDQRNSPLHLFLNKEDMNEFISKQQQKE